jgi:hypothetical protein
VHIAPLFMRGDDHPRRKLSEALAASELPLELTRHPGNKIVEVHRWWRLTHCVQARQESREVHSWSDCIRLGCRIERRASIMTGHVHGALLRVSNAPRASWLPTARGVCLTRYRRSPGESLR